MTGGAPRLSILIPTYNAREVMLDCLASIRACPPSCSYETIVVDDASSDGTADAIRQAFPEVVLIRNATNLRYARSNNVALRQARGDYLYLLNNDTRMLAGTLDALLLFLEQHPKAGAVGGKLLNEDGTLQWTVKALPSAATALFGARSLLTRMFPANRFSKAELLHLQNGDQPFTAGYVSGASMMMTRGTLERVGELDEDFFYLVDADHCKRIWDAGLEVYYLPAAPVVHLNHKGGTMVDGRRRFQSVVDLHWGAYRYARKHLVPSFWHPYHALAVLGLLARFALALALRALRETQGLVAPRADRGPAVPAARPRP